MMSSNRIRAGIPLRARATVWVMAVGAVLAAPAQAMVVNPVYNSSITSQADAATIEAAFGTAASVYASAFSDPVTVNVGVSWGSVDGMTLPASAIGSSVDNLYGYFSYAQVRSWLGNAASTSTDASVLAHLPAASPAGASSYVIPSAEAKALRIVSPAGAGMDGYIGFAGSPSGYSFNPASIASGTFDFVAVAEHELGEVLGRISGLSGSNPSWGTPFDLLRYSGNGAMSFSYAAPAYFSVDGGATDLGDFNVSASGGDRGDWATLWYTTDAQDAFISAGQHKSVSSSDLIALDAIGWSASGNGAYASSAVVSTSGAGSVDPIAEPASIALLGAALAGLGLLRRRVPLKYAR